jgi:hypothetical protein
MSSPDAPSAPGTLQNGFGKSEEDRSEMNALALHAAVRPLQLEDGDAVFEAARVNSDPIGIVASRAVHHKRQQRILFVSILPLFKPSHLNGF